MFSLLAGQSTATTCLPVTQASNESAVLKDSWEKLLVQMEEDKATSSCMLPE